MSLAGTTSGLLFYAVAAAFGLTAVFVAVPVLFDVVRLAGAAYLLWLAWDAIRPRGGGGLFARRDLPTVAPWVLYRTGVLTSILNPKVALFYLALFPQFVDPARGSVLLQSLSLAAVQIVIAAAGDLLFVLAAARVARWLATRPAWITAQRWVLGGVFGAIA
jgi:threonine/homoserine/homoserine lactone efflux protein